MGYLRSSGVEHGLLINFGAPKFEINSHSSPDADLWSGESLF